MGFGTELHWESQKGVLWDLQRVMNLDCVKVNHLVLQLGACLGSHWGCCWVSGLVLLWGID